jgi:uncharacterized protein YkwD
VSASSAGYIEKQQRHPIMNRALIPALFLIASSSVLPAQDGGGAPNPDFLRLSDNWMASSDASKRKAAYRTWMQLGPESLPFYEKALRTAEKHHSKQLDELLRGRTSISNPYNAHFEAARQLDDERVRVMELIRTDYNKDASKVKMLRSEMEALEKLWTRVNRLAKVDTKAFDTAVESATAALVEIARELERFPDSSETENIESDEELLEQLLTDHLEGSYLLEHRKRFQATAMEAEFHAKVEKYNAALGQWASSSMRDFATLLNRERVVCGLLPLVLEEKLSDACRGHSEDMARLGFFAHESPVEGKKSPWDRARLAGFAGNGSGENIYMGSTSHTGAYHGWFGSDGHRFIMFSSGPDVLGLGIAGTRWTLMTGNLRAGASSLLASR